MVVRQREVLEFVAKQTHRGRSITSDDLVRVFLFSSEAACGHLKRLWYERLIEAVLSRPAGFRFRLRPGESIRMLAFRLAPRGRERLDWYRDQEARVKGSPALFRWG